MADTPDKKNDNNDDAAALFGTGYEDDIPFAWKHIILVDKHSHAGRVITKIKQEVKSENKNLEKNGRYPVTPKA